MAIYDATVMPWRNVHQQLAFCALLLMFAAPIVSANRFPADAGVIDVTDPFFGANPNDALDDTAAIQRVFDLISPRGQIVFFPAGTYRISSEIYLRKTDFNTEAESLVSSGWLSVTEGGRSFLRATGANVDPDLAGRMTFNFDAIKAGRVLRLSHRVPSDNGNSFYYRINGGAWQTNTRPFNGDTSWRVDNVVATNIPLVTGSNRLEIAARENGFEIDNIKVGYLGNYLNNVILQGESAATTTLKLQDNLSVGGAPFNGAIVRWESGVEQFFRTAVRDLTFDVGANNPQADGLKFHGNNQSTVANVRFVGLAGSGDVALDLAHTAAIGPILVRDVSVEGFAVGIHSGWQNASRTFDNISLKNQRVYGWVNEAASTIWLRGLRSENAVPAFWNANWRLPGDGQGRVALLDAELIGTGAASTVAAMETLGLMYARNVRVSGYAKAIVNQNQAPFRAYRGQAGVDSHYIDEWWSTGAYGGEGGGFSRQFDAPDTMLGLPIAQTPNVPWDAVNLWDGPHLHVIETAPGVFSGRPDDNVDDTPSIQAAINSGAPSVYFPVGRWLQNGDVTIPASTRRLIGTEAEIAASDFVLRGKIIIAANQAAGPLVIERFANFGFSGNEPVFEHASNRTVVFNDLTGLRYSPTSANAGHVFINDTVGNAIAFRAGQKVWARQLNIEENTTLANPTAEARLVNNGAQVWVLGFKTEQAGVIAKTTAGGMTELLGNMQLNDFGNSTPQYVIEDASMSVVVNIKPYPETGTTYGLVSETRAGVTRQANLSGTGYSGWSKSTLYATRGEIIIDNDDPAAIFAGTWAMSSSFPRGFIGNNFAFAAAGAHLARYVPAITDAGRYQVYARWIGDWGGQDHSNHASNASIEVVHANGTNTITVDQRRYSDGWYPLGEYSFAAGSIGEIRLNAQGANGKVNIDAVRLVRVQDQLLRDGFE